MIWCMMSEHYDRLKRIEEDERWLAEVLGDEGDTPNVESIKLRTQIEMNEHWFAELCNRDEISPPENLTTTIKSRLNREFATEADAQAAPTTFSQRRTFRFATSALSLAAVLAMAVTTSLYVQSEKLKLPFSDDSSSPDAIYGYAEAFFAYEEDDMLIRLATLDERLESLEKSCIEPFPDDWENDYIEDIRIQLDRLDSEPDFELRDAWFEPGQSG